jgi:hypothetical protein
METFLDKMMKEEEMEEGNVDIKTKIFLRHVSKGDCMKIIRIENGNLAELVNCLLDVTGRGTNLPAGSVIVLFSATQLLMQGLAGYIEDLATEIMRIEKTFRGGGGGDGSAGHPNLSGGE